MRVGIDGNDVKRVKFLLPNSTLDEEVICDEYENSKAIWDDDEVKDLGGLEQGSNILH